MVLVFNDTEVNEIRIHPWNNACKKHNWIERADYDCSNGIELYCTGCNAPGILYENGDLVYPTTQYYKVVAEYHDGYFSAFADGRFLTKYNINEWTEATIGGLLVFENLEAAKTFANNGGEDFNGFRIFKCEVEQPVELPPYRSDSGMWRSDFIAKFWDKNISVEGLRWDTASRLPVEISQWPDHTAAFKRVKITEQIYP